MHTRAEPTSEQTEPAAILAGPVMPLVEPSPSSGSSLVTNEGEGKNPATSDGPTVKRSSSSDTLSETSIPAFPWARKNKKRREKALDWLKYFGHHLNNLIRHYASWIGFLQTTTSKILYAIPELVLRLTDLISPIGRIISGLRLLNNTAFHIQGVWSRRLSIVAGISGVSLGILAIAMPPLGLTLAAVNIATNCFLSMWNVGIALKSKYWGEWKELRENREAMEENLYAQLAQNPTQFAKYRTYRSLKDFIELKNELYRKLQEKEFTRLSEESRFEKFKALKAFKTFKKLQVKFYPKEGLDEAQLGQALVEKFKSLNSNDDLAWIGLEHHSFYTNPENLNLADLESNILAIKNQENLLNAELANRSYNMGIIFLALIGIIMVFFPPLVIPGASILLATSIHGILLGYDLASEWPKSIQNFFFGVRKADSNEELERKVAGSRKNAAPLTSTANAQLAFNTAPTRGALQATAAIQERQDSPAATQDSQENSSSLWCCFTKKRQASRHNRDGGPVTLQTSLAVNLTVLSQV